MSGLVLSQLLEQRLRVLQIARVKALGEPAVDRREQFARLLHLALVAPEAGEAWGARSAFENTPDRSEYA